MELNLNWIGGEFELNSNWIGLELRICIELNWHWIRSELELGLTWSGMELELTWNWIRTELGLYWKWIGIEFDLSWTRIELELGLNWIRVEFFSYGKLYLWFGGFMGRTLSKVVLISFQWRLNRGCITNCCQMAFWIENRMLWDKQKLIKKESKEAVCYMDICFLCFIYIYMCVLYFSIGVFFYVLSMYVFVQWDSFM